MTAFEKKCLKIANECGVETMFFDDDRKKHAFEDDGTLHVVSGRGEQCCFCLNQDDPKWSNEKSRELLLKLGLEKHMDNCIVEEINEDDCCPHCGCDCGIY